MKKAILFAIAFAMASMFGLPGSTFAANSDTLVVYASGNSLDAVIGSDTTTGGVQAHSVYKLVSLDTTYIFLGPTTIKSNVTVIGVPGTDGRLPCIQPGVRKNGSSPGTMFTFPKKGVRANFANLYILEISTKNSGVSGEMFDVSADSVSLSLNNIVDDGNQYMVIMYSGSWDNFSITNSIFRNGVNQAGDFYTMQLLSPDLYLPINPADTVVMDYNTFFCDNGGAAGPSYANYLSFVHNTVALSFFGWAPGVYGSGKINDNIFYGVDAGGESKSEFTWMDDPYQPEIASIVNFDTMSVYNDSLFDPTDWGKTNFRMLAEAKRHVEVEDNIYYQPKAIADYQTAYDDTVASKDSIYTPGWMNPRTVNMFNDKQAWPGLTQSGNLVGTDPGYGSGILDAMSAGTDNGVGLLAYIGLVRSGAITTQDWGYDITQVGTAANWVPTWPLPEQTAGFLKYSAALTAPDGKPYGDPYWFTFQATGIKTRPEAVPAKFNLSNNYPNPFNPSTVINVTLNKAGMTSLKIYNVLGELVKVVSQGYEAPGVYKYTVNMDNMASGVYFYTLQQGSNIMTKKMMLLK